MTKTEAIRYLESIGWRFKNKKRAIVSIRFATDAEQYGYDEWEQVTTADLIQIANSERIRIEREATSEPEPIHKQEPTTTATVPILERDTQAIADAIEKACRIVVMVAVACYVAGFTLGTWVHTANAWLVALHKRTCKERLEIVAGYIVSGIVSTKEMVEAWA